MVKLMHMHLEDLLLSRSWSQAHIFIYSFVLMMYKYGWTRVLAYFSPWSFLYLWKLNVSCYSTSCILQFWFKLHLIWWRDERDIWGRRLYVGIGFKVYLSFLMHGQGWRRVGIESWLTMVLFCLFALKWKWPIDFVPHELKRDTSYFISL